MRKTRIVCTIGPATSSPEVMAELIDAGMDVARLNFSHGSHESHRATIRALREASHKAGRPIALLQDLCGPKIRVRAVRPGTVLQVGASIRLLSDDVEGSAERVGISHPSLASDVHVGARVLLDDGLIELEVEAIEGTEVRCKVRVGGPLGSNKGVNFPGVPLSVPSVTPKDLADLALGLEEGVDFVALSFVRSAADVLQVKEQIRACGADTPVLVKIEKLEALEHLESILEVADGAMVARGDLGVEISYEQVPLEQKRIIRLCRQQAKPVITATQMLDSMMRNPRPTRAEAADVANAVLDGTDAVMLSGETAAGLHPVEAVRAMARIAEAAETALPYADVVSVDPQGLTPANALSLAACELAERLQASVLVACSSAGDSVRRLIQFRPRAPVLAIVHTERLERRLQLYWGVVASRAPHTDQIETLLSHARTAACATGLARPGDLGVIQATVPVDAPGGTNMLKIDVLGGEVTGPT